MSDCVIVEDDLEEGEIPDDSSEPEVINPPKLKPKKLPKRYTLEKNKDSKNRHKNCKHQHKVKNCVSLNTEHKRKHKYSCSKHSTEKYKEANSNLTPLKNNLPVIDKNYETITQNSNLFASKCAFKNYSSPPRAVLNFQKPDKASNKKDVYSKLLSDYKKKQVNKKLSSTKNGNYVSKSDPLASKCAKRKIEKETTTKSPRAENIVDTPKLAVDNQVSVDDSDDEEELRRLALATCFKKADSGHKTVDCLNGSDELFLGNTKVTADKVQISCDNVSSDNYEVVDMELDTESFTENVNNDTLFIIDKNPSVLMELNQNSWNNTKDELCESNLLNDKQNLDSRNAECVLSASSECNDDDFEAELLRAELIASISTNRQSTQSGLISQAKEEKQTINVACDAVPKNVSKSQSMYSKYVNSRKFTRGNIQKPKMNHPYLSKTKITSNTLTKNVNASKQRLVINLNDSSTEESDEEAEKHAGIENIPASIEALISDARHKSDVKSTNANTVSCLSKAQQEEYNSLKKILAEKDITSAPAPKEKTSGEPNMEISLNTDDSSLPAQTTQMKEKSAADLPNLNFLLNRIVTSKEELKDEIILVSDIEKDLLKKKKNYMASKLKVQHLKEQLHAAEVVRARHLESWKKCSAKLGILKESVSKRTVLINLLESEFKSRKFALEQIVT